ncbi:hypothetical protein AL064_18830 [Pseudomonas syringae pv. syringae]|uniref:hypothetical protein n=1 Tax=Pseudomonas syringae TaxID=317 RepID=UPI00076059FA|nr:hypothetical protein [Pseudomonas syringae]KWS07469.1 hypothetical protein AL064_18830 [Pseudomonas syringae pv. syringae]
MSFEKIQDSQFDLTRNAAFHAGQVKSFAAKLSKGINELLNAEHPAEYWGTSCCVAGDGIVLHISTPFGQARAVAIVQLSGGNIGVRYVFEKLVSSSNGGPFFRPVWAVHISSDGKVSSEDGELIYHIQSISGLERDNGVATVALSAIYAIATDEGYFVADEKIG